MLDDTSKRRLSASEAVVIGVFILFCGALVLWITQRSQPESRPPGQTARSVTIYASMPLRAAGNKPIKRSEDMQRAINLALDRAERKAGRLRIVYRLLNAADGDGNLDARVVANATTAVRDPNVAVYIGDFTSDGSIKSIPILSKAGIAQISPNSTRVALTDDDPYGDIHETERLYRGAARNFVRMMPNDNVQAAALTALMQDDGCRRVAVVYDGDDYSDGLTNNQKAFDRPALVFRQQVRPKAAPRVYLELAALAADRRADCFQYVGGSHPDTTLQIFQAFRDALGPAAKLYATESVRESTFTEAAKSDGGCVDAKLMVPPRDPGEYVKFLDAYQKRHPDVKDPDPTAVYAYEAVRLALAAIEATPNGKRREVLDELYGRAVAVSPLGPYEIDDFNGDTELVDYDVSLVRNCVVRPPERAVGLTRLRRMLRVLEDAK